MQMHQHRQEMVRQQRRGVGAAAAPLAAAALAAVDPELEPDPVKPIREELDDEIPW